MFWLEAGKYALGGIFGKDEEDRTVGDYFGGPLTVFTPWGEVFVPESQLFSYSVVKDDWANPRWQKPAAIHDNGYSNNFKLFDSEGKLVTSSKDVIDVLLLHEMIQAATQLFLDDIRHKMKEADAIDLYAQRIIRARIAYSGVRAFGTAYHQRKFDRRNGRRPVLRRKGVHHA